jgi:hypothetical protein
MWQISPRVAYSHLSVGEVLWKREVHYKFEKSHAMKSRLKEKVKLERPSGLIWSHVVIITY